MKELSIARMESLNGGGFIGGACAVIGITDTALVGEALVGRAVAFAIPGAGTAMAIATLGCFAYGVFR